MTTISTLNNSGYYQLSDPSAGPSGGASTDPAAALLQALGNTSANGQASSPSNAYLLDLSPQAQQLLSGSGSAVSPLGSTSQSFALTNRQQQTIATIMAQYKDAPYTQATFDQIQNSLQAAGLDPTTLSEIDQAQSFDPAAILADDLNGNTNAANALAGPADESNKAANYIQQIITEWQNMSGNASPASGTGGA